MTIAGTRTPLSPARPLSRYEQRRVSARRRRNVRLARTVAVGVTLVVVIVSLFTRGGPPARTPNPGSHSVSGVPNAQVILPAGGPFPVGTQSIIFTDSSRSVALPNGTSEPRPLATTVYYPAIPKTGSAQADGTQQDATPYLHGGPYPLVVFAPGYEKLPSTYNSLLSAWARAGYVVAAITFPLTNPNAPGGPDELDIVNQPRDINFVIGKILGQASAPGPLFSGLVASGGVAVAGHSDGGDSVMAAAFNTCCRNSAIKAAIILSGAELNEPGGSYFPSGSPVLLAVQGTADTVNLPSFTTTLFEADTASPAYELLLQGAGPLDAYSTNDTFGKVTSAVTVDFLNAYLKGSGAGPSAITRDGTVSGVATVTSSIPTTPTSAAGGIVSTSAPSGSPQTSGPSATAPPGYTGTTVFIPTAN